MSVNRKMNFLNFLKSYDFLTSEEALHIDVKGEFPKFSSSKTPRNAQLTDNRDGSLEFYVANALNRRYLNDIVYNYLEECGCGGAILLERV